MTRRQWFRFVSPVSAAVPLLCLVPSLAVAGGATPAWVTVDTHAGLGITSATGLGVNDAIWDPALGTSETSALLREAGVQTMRYPGGSYGDMYHWQTHTTEPGGYVAPNTDFDTFMASVKKVHAQPIIIANYGTGTAAEAAGWVKYANRTKRYDVKYWEIGNEIYGNGHYGAAWEADNHADLGPSAYANAVVEYAAAMKAVDPSVKIGAVLTTPGNWPDGLIAGGDAGSWNQVVLSIAGPSIDFVILHWYPGGDSPAEALAKSAQAADMGEIIRTQIAKYAGNNSSRIGIALTEINTSQGPDTQPGALFAADMYPSLWAAGMFTVNWWDVHNVIDTVGTFAGQTDYKDFGFLSSASCLRDNSVCEPPLNTPFAPYFAVRMLGGFANPGDQLIRVTSGTPMVRGHAVRHKDGGLSVLLLNEDPNNAQPVSVRYPGFVPAPVATVYSYGNGATDITRGHAGPFAQTLPPYSLTMLVLRPLLELPLPSAPGAPAVSNVTDTSATVTWARGEVSLLPALSYDVYVQDANGSRLAGQTRSTTYGITGLRAGTRYTVTIVAKSILGIESWSSSPAAFVTGTPATSTCAVHLADVNDWGSGYVASIDITNSGTEAISGWTLAFTLPRAWESFGGGWNADWIPEGVSLSATNVDWNATIAPGATASIGLIINNAGPNVLPSLFTLNGTVCTTK